MPPCFRAARAVNCRLRHARIGIVSTLLLQPDIDMFKDKGTDRCASDTFRSPCGFMVLAEVPSSCWQAGKRPRANTIRPQIRRRAADAPANRSQDRPAGGEDRGAAQEREASRTCCPMWRSSCAAPENIVRFKEFYSKDSGKWTLDCLDRGLERAEQLAKGKTPWTTLEKRNVLRAYRSVIDGTAQPYGVTYPLEYGKDPKKKWRVDVVLHGRNSSLTEVAFLNSHNGNEEGAAGSGLGADRYFRPREQCVSLGGGDGCHARRSRHFSGRDKCRWRPILPGQRSCRVARFLDGRRRYLASWPALSRQWCVMGPGAGFTTTHGYAVECRNDCLIIRKNACASTTPSITRRMRG